jgi:predicted DNA-binding helix-hairpin-helix protein
VQKAGLYADRLSVNIELPTQADLKDLAPEKDRAKLEGNMSLLKDKADEMKDTRKTIRKTPIFLPAGQSTQMIVGADATDDRTILATSAGLYGVHRLRRVYYSAFSPIPDASAELPLIAPNEGGRTMVVDPHLRAPNASPDGWHGRTPCTATIRPATA